MADPAKLNLSPRLTVAAWRDPAHAGDACVEPHSDPAYGGIPRHAGAGISRSDDSRRPLDPPPDVVLTYHCGLCALRALAAKYGYKLIVDDKEVG